MNKTEQALARLQRLFENGELRPGSMVSESVLANMTGFGRTPIREAVQRLALSHMIRIHPSKGIEIPPISVENQLSGLEVRRALEVLSVTLACQRATEAQLAEMRALASTLDGDFSLEGYGETMRETHRMIIEAAHNPYLGAHMRPLQALSRRFWFVHVRDEKREIEAGSALHRQILEAIANRDIENAAAASQGLNDYLVEFATEIVTRRSGQAGIAIASLSS